MIKKLILFKDRVREGGRKWERVEGKRKRKRDSKI